MTKLEDHLEGIINIFHQYSVRTGHFDTLTKCELKKLITTELANTIQNTKDRSAVDQIFRDLDEDRDGQVDFNEFLSLVSAVLLTTHDNIHKE